MNTPAANAHILANGIRRGSGTDEVFGGIDGAVDIEIGDVHHCGFENAPVPIRSDSIASGQRYAGGEDAESNMYLRAKKLSKKLLRWIDNA